MNYITEIKAFYDWLETNPLPSPAIVLWHALMHIANKTGWQQEFAVAISVLEVKTGLSAKAVARARNILSLSGLILWKKRKGNQSALYQINSLCDKNTYTSVPQPVPQSVLQSVPQPVPQSVHINKLNKTKQNETNKKGEKENNIASQETDSTSEPCAPSPRLPYKKVVDLFNSICLSLPKVQTISEARKKAIKTRFNSGVTLEKFEEVFRLVENSKFLKGDNNRNWSANFDWIIKGTNLTKIAEGNYNNPSTFSGGDSSYDLDEIDTYWSDLSNLKK